MTCTAGCAGVGVVFVLLVFLYKPDNVEEIETVLAEHQRPKEIDTNEIKNLFKKELPDFDFSLTTTTTTTTTATTTTTITTTTSILGEGFFSWIKVANSHSFSSNFHYQDFNENCLKASNSNFGSTFYILIPKFSNVILETTCITLLQEF